MQRIGRAGHHVGGTSIGRILPKFRGDLLEATVVAKKMLEGEVESIRVPDSALVAFGFGDAAKSARSASASLVFERCAAVIDAFTGADAQQCKNLVDLRNRELHTGELVFGGWAADSLAETYRLLRVLAGHAGRTLEDLLGEESGAAAEDVVAAAEEKNTKEVTKKLTTATTYFFDVLGEAEQAEQQDRAMRASQIRSATVEGGKPVSCPICDSQASLQGRVIRTSPEQLDGFELVSNHTHQPTAFACSGCRLDLPSLREIYVAAKVNPAFKPLTSPFTLEIRAALDEYVPDPADFYEEFMDE